MCAHTGNRNARCIRAHLFVCVCVCVCARVGGFECIPNWIEPMPSSFVRLVIASRFWNFDFNSVALSLPPSFILERKPAGANTKKIAMREWRKAQIYHTWCAGDTKESRFCARKYLSDVLRLQKKILKRSKFIRCVGGLIWFYTYRMIIAAIIISPSFFSPFFYFCLFIQWGFLLLFFFSSFSISIRRKICFYSKFHIFVLIKLLLFDVVLNKHTQR